jgi:hypothetical protein
MQLMIKRNSFFLNTLKKIKKEKILIAMQKTTKFLKLIVFSKAFV